MAYSGYKGKENRCGGVGPNGNDREKYRRPPVRKHTESGSGEETDEPGIIYGRNPVLELLSGGRKPEKLFVSSGEREGSKTLIVAKAIDMGIPVISSDRRRLDSMTENANHQGVVALVSFKDYCTVDDILDIAAQRNEPPFIVIADNVEDPGNLGAMIRCCDIAGVHGLIIPRRHGVGITAVTAKASAGALEHIAVAKVPNIAACIDHLKEKGVWIYAAEAGGEELKKADLRGSAAFVFGSEGNGISRLVLDKCDFRISIGMYGKVNSLNVSCASAVVLCEASWQRRKG